MALSPISVVGVSAGLGSTSPQTTGSTSGLSYQTAIIARPKSSLSSSAESPRRHPNLSGSWLSSSSCRLKVQLTTWTGFSRTPRTFTWLMTEHDSRLIHPTVPKSPACLVEVLQSMFMALAQSFCPQEPTTKANRTNPAPRSLFTTSFTRPPVLPTSSHGDRSEISTQR